MQLSKQFSAFLDAAKEDVRLTPAHISLYCVLLYSWNKQAMESPLVIIRKQVMLMSKISGRSTYNKCMHELHNYGYIQYQPSFNAYVGSLVFLSGFPECIATIRLHKKRV